LPHKLRGLSPSDRAEIVLELREHFEDARRELHDPTEADLRNIVERLGPPAEIAAEARLRFGVTELTPTVEAVPKKTFGALEVAALVAWFIWWPVGVLLTALSPRWSRRDKAVAVVVQLVAFATIDGLLPTPAYLFSNGSRAVFGHLGILVVLMVAPPSVLGFFGAGYLVWKAVSGADRAWSRSWQIAGRAAGLILGGWLFWTLVLGPLTLLLMHSSASGP